MYFYHCLASSSILGLRETQMSLASVSIAIYHTIGLSEH